MLLPDCRIVAVDRGGIPSLMQQYGVEVVMMPKVGHFLMTEDLKRFNHTLTTILRKVDT